MVNKLKNIAILLAYAHYGKTADIPVDEVRQFVKDFDNYRKRKPKKTHFRYELAKPVKTHDIEVKTILVTDIVLYPNLLFTSGGETKGKCVAATPQTFFYDELVAIFNQLAEEGLEIIAKTK